MAAPAPERPRIRVAALIVLDGKVVLVRHCKDERRYYLLPGGGVDFGETLEQALVREVAEETGLVCTLVRPLVINDTIDPRGTRHVVNVTFECKVISGTVTDEPHDPRVEAVELVEGVRLRDIDLRPPLAEELLLALNEGARYRPTYLGSVFTDTGEPE